MTTTAPAATPSLRRRPSAIPLGRAPSFSARASPLASPLACERSQDAFGFTAEPVGLLETPPSTPPCGSYFNQLGVGWGGEKLVRRNSSLSVASSMGSEDDTEDDADWTEGEKDRLKRTVEMYLANTATAGSPFVGAPPSNLTQIIARAVVSNKADRVLRSTRQRDDKPPPKWPHGMKSTRAKIIALVREREASIDETPRQGDADATPRRRKPLQRQGSMDFLPESSRNVGIVTVARLGSKIHRAEQGPPHSHPYAITSRGRLNRTNSLSSIAGSPTQPATSSSTSSRGPHPPVVGSMGRASSRMLRVASDHSAGHISSSDYFNFNKRSESSGSLHPMMALDLSDREVPPSRAAPALLGLAFAESPKQAKKKAPIGGGLASAFHSPALEYPSPVSLRKNKSASPRRASGSGGASSMKKQRLDFGAGDSSSSASSTSDDDAEMPSPSRSPSRLALDAYPFPSTTLTTPSGRTVPAARERFYLAGSPSASSTSTASSWTPSSYFSSGASSDASASTVSLGLDEDHAMRVRTPSPACSTLDLDELSLGKEDDEEKTVAEGAFKGWNWGRQAAA